MNYALLDSEGYIVATGSGPALPEGCVELPDISSAPDSFYRFNYNERKWVPMPNEQKIFSLTLEAKNKRNELLASSDWTQTVDSPLSEEKKAAWAVYRKQLRDITQQPDFPLNIIWPNRPV